MTDRGAFVKVFPAKTELEMLKEFQPSGYFLSNGPGDPAAMDYAVETVKNILKEEKPLFGICLGHQLLALAKGIPTFKMHHGHRGLNHPVKNLVTGKCEITTQNHGFGVDPVSVKKNREVEVTHVNLNDDSIEGIRSEKSTGILSAISSRKLHLALTTAAIFLMNFWILSRKIRLKSDVDSHVLVDGVPNENMMSAPV